MELAKLAAKEGQGLEVEEAEEDITADNVDEGLTWRLAQASEAMNRAQRGETEDKAEYHTANNGMALSRDELKHRDKLFANIVFENPKNRR